MSNLTTKTRYAYIDNMKLAACVIVALSHLYTSLVAHKILIDGDFFKYFMFTVYTFHVPVFLVCSGFLYQKSNRVHSLGTWKNNVLNKLLNLGVPYFVFTLITLALKHLAEDSVTTKAGGVISTLFYRPTAPYWYLYALFFMFLLIPCVKSVKGAAVLFAICTALRVVFIAVLHSYAAAHIPILKYILSLSFWFSLGMLISFVDFERIKRYLKFISPALMAAALILSVRFLNLTMNSSWFNWFIGVLFVAAIVTSAVAYDGKLINKIGYRFSKLFMPVYLMHTIFAAGIRIILLHLGITNSVIHIIGGLIGSFVITSLVYLICEKLTPLMFFFYPSKTIKILRQKNEQNKKPV